MIRLTDEQIDIKLVALGVWADYHTVGEAIAQTQLRKDYEWGDELCLEHLADGAMLKRHECWYCWNALKEEAGL